LAYLSISSSLQLLYLGIFYLQTVSLKTVVLDDNLTLRDIAQHFWKPPPGNELADPEPWITLNYRPVALQ